MTPEFSNWYSSIIVLEGDADEHAPGAAITMELCGHWEHDGDCRWPHHTAYERSGNELSLTCAFEAPEHEVEEVRDRIELALDRGELAGPDGQVSRWSVER
jgi:hypothetical protein